MVRNFSRYAYFLIILAVSFPLILFVSGCGEDTSMQGKSTEELVKILDKGTRVERAKAVAALGHVKGKKDVAQAVPALIEAFRDREKMVRQRSIKALATIGKPAEKDLLKAMKTGGTLVKWHAAQALKRIGTPKGLEAYQKYMETEGKGVTKIKVGTG